MLVLPVDRAKGASSGRLADVAAIVRVRGALKIVSTDEEGAGVRVEGRGQLVAHVHRVDVVVARPCRVGAGAEENLGWVEVSELGHICISTGLAHSPHQARVFVTERPQQRQQGMLTRRASYCG